MTQTATNKVRKAVIPAAGLGTRLRPQTKYLPKEMLPIGSKPLIQYTLEMYMDAGVSQICIVTNQQKPQLQRFLSGQWLPPELPFERNKNFFEQLSACEVHIIMQPDAIGVADAVSLAKNFVGKEPFFCIMPDCLTFSPKSFAKQILDSFIQYKTNIIGSIYIDQKDAERFGNVGILETYEMGDSSCFIVKALSEKKREALQVEPGTRILKGFGGGVYLPGYFDLAERMRHMTNGEIDDVPIHQVLIKERELRAQLLDGYSFDTGHPLGFRAAAHYVGRTRELCK